MKIERVGTLRCKVGEGPVWDVAEQALYFIDLLDCALWRHHPASGEFRRWQMPSFIGSVALRRNGGALVALQDGLHTVDLESGTVEAFADPANGDTLTQSNDGKVDSRGRFVFGTQPRSITDTRQLGRVFRVDPDGRPTTLDSGFGITNGPCWSPDDRTFYVADSLRKVIHAYDYDIETGSVANRRPFADVGAFGGIPDGATTDTQGRVWTALCGGGKVVALRPDGEVDRVVDVPVPMVSSVMFGGPDLDRLYITSIDGAVLGMGLPPDETGGALFVIDGLGAQGRAEPRFAG